MRNLLQSCCDYTSFRLLSEEHNLLLCLSVGRAAPQLKEDLTTEGPAVSKIGLLMAF